MTERNEVLLVGALASLLRTLEGRDPIGNKALPFSPLSFLPKSAISKKWSLESAMMSPLLCAITHHVRVYLKISSMGEIFNYTIHQGRPNYLEALAG